MSVGMAVDSRKEAEKAELAELLKKAAQASFQLNLWIDGKPFANKLAQIAEQLISGLSISV